MTMVSLGGLVLPFSITVLERQDMDFLIGLDQLKRHQMQIDLKANCLRIDEHALPFLSEGELPVHLRKESAGENEEDEGVTASKAQSDSAAAAVARNSPQSRTAGEAERTSTLTPTTANPIPASPPPAPPLDEEKVARLQEMTQLPTAVIRGALEACDGSEDAAAMMLLDS
jgi:hypothetical protein